MTLSEEEIVRRREALRSALTMAGLAVGGPVIDAAARLEEPPGSGDYERLVRIHATWFTSMPAADHLYRLVRDWNAVNNFNKPYLAGMISETLADLGEFERSADWLAWARENAHARGQDEWLRARASILSLNSGQVDRIPNNPVGVGAASFARAQAALGNARAATAAIERAGRYTAYAREPFTAFTFPAFQYHRYASEVHTKLRNTATARDHQVEALAGYPAYDLTSRARVNLDRADVLRTEGRRDEARETLYETLQSLPANRRYNVVKVRAAEIAAQIT